MMKAPKTESYLIPFLYVILLLGSCAAQKDRNSSNEPLSLLVLLEDNYSISDIELLNNYSVESAKRTSRSQNLWFVKVAIDEAEKEAFLKALAEADEVSSVTQPTSEGATNSTNKDSKKAKPKKNNR